MTQKNKAAQSQGTSAQTTESKVQPINAAIEAIKQKREYFERLNQLSQKRQILLNHLEKLDTLSNHDEFNADLTEDETSSKVITKISLNFSSDRYDVYEIKNAVLLDDVRKFLTERLKIKVTETENEIFTTMG